MSRSTSPGNRYGRQGGGWTESTGRVSDALAAIDRLRQQGKKDGTWPELSAGAQFRPKEGDEGYNWAGAARMARARLEAGVPLTDIDHEALRRPKE